MFHGVESLRLQLYGDARLLKGSIKRASNWVDEGTKSPNIIGFTKIFKQAI